MFAHPRNSGTTSATGGNNEKIGTPKAVKPPGGAVRASALLAASTGLACFLVYASGVPRTNAPNEGGAGRNTLSAPQQPGTERPGFVERLRSVRLEDTFDFIADDGLGLVAAELAVRSTPIGEPVRRLALAPALVGAATISVLVVVMLRLGIARVAALASALTFAFSYPALHSALTIDASMARAPTLVGVFCCLLARTDHRRSRGFWGAALVLWLLGTLAEPVLLCVLPGMAIFMYMVERDRRRCGYLGTTAAIGGGLLFGLLLAMSGMVAPTSVAAGGSDQFAGFLAAVRPLGLAFLLAAAFRLCERPTREELLVWASWCAAVAWILVGTESVDTQRLSTVLILTIPLAGFGMSAVLGSQPGRGHVRATGILMLVLPGSSLMGAVDELDALREDRARRLADAQVLAAALPQGAVVATARNVHEPIAGIWRFAGANGPQVVNAPLDLRRMLRLRAELPIFVFEPTRVAVGVPRIPLLEPGLRRGRAAAGRAYDALAELHGGLGARLGERLGRGGARQRRNRLRRASPRHETGPVCHRERRSARHRTGRRGTLAIEYRPGHVRSTGSKRGRRPESAARPRWHRVRSAVGQPTIRAALADRP